MKELTPKTLSECNSFVCGNQDLDDFFSNDCINYSSQMLGKSYCFTLDEDTNKIVCAFTVSNDSIKTTLLPKKKRNKLNRKIPYSKQKGSYPSTLIGRLGVANEFAGNHYGDQLMDFIKSWFLDSKNKTGCRYIVVDAYNKEKPLKYYKRNGFEFLFDTEMEEREYTGKPLKLFKYQKIINKIKSRLGLKETILDPLNTRLMYFDLILLKTN